MASIVMTGGGTGGHLAIVKAVKEQLGDQRLVYIGSTGGQDRRWFAEDEDFAARYFLESRGVVNQGILGKVHSVGLLLRGIAKARKILRREEAGVVFSVGGYSAAPAAIAAVLSGIPLVIHEQNAVSGSLNRLLKPYAKAFISSYDPESPIHAYPVKSVFFQKARVRHEVKRILFLGGSQGAVAINRLALALAPELQKRGIAISHQAGERNVDEVRKAYEELGIEAEVFGFSDRIPELMAAADFAVARAGASTLWELAANGLPTLFVPYPYAAGDHQYHNARFLAEKGLAWVRREDDLQPGEVLELFGDDLERVSRGLMEEVSPDGSAEIATLLRSCLS
ncbi:MAG TPA: undecaprenyldiphospho-muramoylpentapeptide beta-N-acetylglucosaminyltransferase [Nitratifractor salsuginis]|uniref:UDP-N-acetylglucosamine--N-acetylmuramyl-(pentapeptide) pyrophosphoryl-undecaprenol N-acetylglucosamine transferase n=1 Tax=Nitratifractor salsuginis TaxID=269261 RepID=A0A7V2SJR8_9BACT|nr:undecaprenyldiphospho-muramoylpentapeptide beta-N-acetylglucosaminyltransferase [Nitratifractor salsuginis]